MKKVEGWVFAMMIEILALAAGFANQSLAEDDLSHVVHMLEFGAFEQDGVEENGAEPIVWNVLAVDGESALLMSQHDLAVLPYAEGTAVSALWEGSGVRKWLNGDFLHDAFTEEDRELILLSTVHNGADQSYTGVDGGEDTQDYVFLLSYAEYAQYVRPEELGDPEKHQYLGATKAIGWPSDGYWLRSPGESAEYATEIDWDGTVSQAAVSGEADWEGYAVRPCLWVQRDLVDPGE